MNPKTKKRLETLVDQGLLPQDVFERMMGSGRVRSKKPRASAVAVACGPNSKAHATSNGGEVEAIAGPGETVEKHN